MGVSGMENAIGGRRNYLLTATTGAVGEAVSMGEVRVAVEADGQAARRQWVEE